MENFNTLLRRCVNELATNEGPENVHDFYRCRLNGRIVMERRYNHLSEKQETAVSTIYDAYNAADTVRELCDNGRAFIEDENGNIDNSQEYLAAVAEFDRLLYLADRDVHECELEQEEQEEQEEQAD